MALNNILVPNLYNLDANSISLNSQLSGNNPGGATTLWVDDLGNLMYDNHDISNTAAGGTVTSVAAGAGLVTDQVGSGPITTSGTISMAALSPDPSGTIAMPQVTVNAYGQVTNAVVGTKMSYNGAGNGNAGPLPINAITPVTLALYNDPPDLAIDASIFNPTTGIFTAPVNGVYMLYFVCPIIVNSANTVVTFNALILGTPFPMLAFHTDGLNTHVCNGSYCTRLFANETLAIQVAINNAGGVVPDTSYFNMTVIQIA